ncbi:MAG: hypothetical protein II531_03055 [Bacteroidales bacterium]|nr:hypothetical protein [Bacteroidales bacterium]
MKKLSILLLCIVTLAATSCNSLQKAASSNSAAAASGQLCGNAVKGLYQSYKNDGKLDVTSGSNLTNALSLATAYSQLKDHKNDKSYRKAFASGLVVSSAGLITDRNSISFINQLLSSAALSGLNRNNIVSKGAATATSIVNLLSIIKQ